MNAPTPKISQKNIFYRFEYWFNHNLLKIDAYQLDDAEIVSLKNKAGRFKIQDVSSWQQIFWGTGVSSIVIKFADGREADFSDKHEDLFHILEKTIPEKELPWKAI